MSARHYFLTPDGLTGWRGDPEAFPEGAIAISESDHGDVLAAKAANRETTVIGGELVIRDKAPSPEHAWEHGEWVVEPEPPAPAPFIADVKAEAFRRLAKTDWYVTRATDPGDGTQVPQAIIDERQAIRTASAAIEAMDPIPADFRQDVYWAAAE